MSDQEAIWKWRLRARITDLERALENAANSMAPGEIERREAMWVLHDQSWMYRAPNNNLPRIESDSSMPQGTAELRDGDCVVARIEAIEVETMSDTPNSEGAVLRRPLPSSGAEGGRRGPDSDAGLPAPSESDRSQS